MLWSAFASAIITAGRTCSTPLGCGSGALSRAVCAATAGAADPMTIGVVLVAAGDRTGAALLLSAANSDRGVPLRAESAANGETKGREGPGGSDFFGSGASVSLRSVVAPRFASTPLSNCSRRE